MIISEKQVLKLMRYLSLGLCGTLTQEGCELGSKLITEIINQQTDKKIDLEE